MKIVHVLNAGHALCGFGCSPETGCVSPGNWPKGHFWASLELSNEATCKDCLEVLELIQKIKFETADTPASAAEKAKQTRKLADLFLAHFNKP